MRLVATNRLNQGMILAKSIYNAAGQVLLHRDVILTGQMINRLRELAIPYVYIRDQLTSDIEMEEPLSPKTRQKVISTVKTHFGQIIKERHWERSLNTQQMVTDFKETVEAMVNEIGSRVQAIDMLINVHAFDHYTFQHSINVTLYTLFLAYHYRRLNEKQLIELGLGAMLHDVGKLHIDKRIINKPGPLTDEEYKIIKQHTEHGFEMLRKIDNLPLLSAHCAYQHHERIDGSGYPLGTKDIHRYSKLLMIADVFDALTSDRAYRKAMPPHLAMELIYSEAGTKFDLELVRLFGQTVNMYPIGSTVKLNNGYEGVVVAQNKGMPARPIIRLVKNQADRPLDRIEEIDLSKVLDITIADCYYA